MVGAGSSASSSSGNHFLLRRTPQQQQPIRTLSFRLLRQAMLSWKQQSEEQQYPLLSIQQQLRNENLNFANHNNHTIRSSMVRWFQSEADYHHTADATLEALMDAIESALEGLKVSEDENFEVNLAAGVLTIQIPPHGTWVINKQTPNQQLWWSSPLSGPKRFEYEESKQAWLPTKDGDDLVHLLSQEFSHIVGQPIDLNV
ncbi:hypothetical protein ACA910_014582 [Epithemia clementina (nom. ined.)]